MKNMINKTRIEGYIYDHDLKKKVSGENSKNPGTEYIAGVLNVATDDAGLNIVPVHFTYVTAVTGSGKENATFTTLNTILSGNVKTIMSSGKDAAAKVRIDSAIALNEFYTQSQGQTEPELVSVKRNEGGFVHFTDSLNEDEKTRNTFECDIVITGFTRVPANEERDIPEKGIIKGAIFGFRKNLIPVEFTALNPNAINYFEDLEISSKNPTFTKVWGRQISEVIIKTQKEESAFGEAKVRETRSTRKDFVITGASQDPYEWDVEGMITVAELNDAITARATELSTLKQRYEAYKNGQNQPAPVAKKEFNF